MNKKAIDAVNDFKGDWPYSCNCMIICTRSISNYVIGDLTGYSRNDFTGLNSVNWSPFCTQEEFNQCVDDCSNNKGWENIKPVYTQEMADKGTLPCVGMEFTVVNVDTDSRILDFKGKNVLVISTAKFNNKTVITFSHPTMGIGCGIYYDKWVKPITPPITLEDGKAYQFDYVRQGNVPGVYDTVKNCFYGASGYCYIIMDCTNIKLLEVKS